MEHPTKDSRLGTPHEPGEGPDPRWAALASRDPRATFFYAVRTTGVYCRPSCGARAPRPEHVTFYDTAEGAARAGYRPCLRCRPDQPTREARRAALVAELCRLLEREGEPADLATLAAHAGLSTFETHRVFKAVTGVTPRAFAAAVRARRAQALLASGATVTDAVYGAGYGSSGRFYAESDGRLGMTPTAYRRGGEGMTLRVAVGEGSLGAVLVAATARGVCAILLGDDPEALLGDLRRRLPRAEIIRGDEDFQTTVDRALALVERPGDAHELPLDLRGTAFQERVWRALREIPAGETRTYAALAEALGAPGAARAVAGACAANPLAVAVPCHRAVGRGGALTGYRWGLERKRALLERERTR